jgi:1-aminocyclopropane-1-carboxylate deaminase/D-cysteine desulfhydrase-like pyridoxal-dependent ACC family enzyme
MNGETERPAISLFKQYPELGKRLPYVPLCDLPTPVHKLEHAGAELGLKDLYIKRDDLSGQLYGGNKPRKLEFLLGDALRARAKKVLTFGGAGSNHALATALYAQKLGLKSISMLTDQPNAHYVRKNLLMSRHAGAELHLCGSGLESSLTVPLFRFHTVLQMLKHFPLNGRFPRMIPAGGSSPLGIIGFVNAAFELRDQIERGEMPEPERIYVAAGTMGTSSGLMLGLRAASINCKVIAVRVVGEEFTNIQGMLDLIGKTNSLLHSLDPSFPAYEFIRSDVEIKHGFYGRRYAVFTREAVEAVAFMQQKEDIMLEGTYTGKAFAALLDDARHSHLQGTITLFWNTSSSRDLSAAISDIDYHRLPRSFHKYFEEDVQPLDRKKKDEPDEE